MHRTRRSGLRVAVTMDHAARGTSALRLVTQTSPDSARVVAIDELEPGQRLSIVTSRRSHRRQGQVAS
jgi:hypothetical protein